MMDLSPLDKLCRKRNMLLQKQLDVRMAIIQEEYRMTKKDMDKDHKDLGDFVHGLQQTAPGLSAYGSPDTRAMNEKNRRDRGYSGSAKVPASTIDPKKRPGSARQVRRDPLDDDDTERKKRPVSGPSTRMEYFNRKIVLDSRRRSFLQHHATAMTSAPSKKPDNRSLLGGAVSQPASVTSADKESDTAAKRAQSATTRRSFRPKTPQYGSDAYTLKEEWDRKKILRKFDVIFDPDPQKGGRLHRKYTPAATPIAIAKRDDVKSGSNRSEIETNKPSTTKGFMMNRRVAWSAPAKRREDPIAAVAQTNRQVTSATPRSGGIAQAFIKAIQNASSGGSNNQKDTGDGFDLAKWVAKTWAKKTFEAEDGKRRTAPANFELRQRGMKVPRQQVAGILAEIQSRRADTRAMLLKSKQIKQMVKSLAPPETRLEDSFSD